MGGQCDACGRPESSLEHPKDQLLTCSGCLVAKYCSKQRQKKDWSNSHKGQCHLYEVNRKLSSVFAKSLGPGNFLNAHNHLVIAAAALKNDEKFAGIRVANVAISLSLS
ncbi:hypothetical protein B0H14DRAFT_3152785 [Mycena olivaceomarginata]|nr:hypothetical protein B0H14DRAFT_3152785 [Mycena olivaceomarginata]